MCLFFFQGGTPLCISIWLRHIRCVFTVRIRRFINPLPQVPAGWKRSLIFKIKVPSEFILLHKSVHLLLQMQFSFFVVNMTKETPTHSRWVVQEAPRTRQGPRQRCHVSHMDILSARIPQATALYESHHLNCSLPAVNKAKKGDARSLDFFFFFISLVLSFYSVLLHWHLNLSPFFYVLIVMIFIFIRFVFLGLRHAGSDVMLAKSK